MMKKFILIVVLAIILCGCELPFIGNGEKKQGEIIVQLEENITQENITQENVTQENTSMQMEESSATRIEESNLTEKTVEKVTNNNSINVYNPLLYAYETLTEKQQKLYKEIFSILGEVSKEVEVSTLNEEEIDFVFQCVMQDHPEIFYVDGYTFKKYTENDNLTKITFSGIYIYDINEIRKRQGIIKNEILNILQGIDRYASDYEKVKYVYEYIIDHTDYQLESIDNQNICSVFVTHKSVCQGYAKATQYLLKNLGVESVLVTGSVKNGQGHAWNLVKMDNEYYYVDTTWGDASYTMNDCSGIEMKGEPDINYDYLGITTDELLKTHEIDEIVSMPICNATENNYYVKEGIYFTSLDLEKIEKIFVDARAKNQELVILKCANQQVYEEMLKYLLDDQKIFDYLDIKEESIAYANSDEQHSLSFWL